MGLIDWHNNLSRKLRFPDISLIKLATAGFVLLLAKLWPPLLSLDWPWYLVIGLVPTFILMPKMFKK